MVRASAASYPGFFKPVMRIRLVVERLDFRVSATAIQRLRFLKRPIGLEPERAHSKIARARFQHFENAPADAEAARVGGDPHALDLADHPLLQFERTAPDRPTAEAGDDEDAGRGAAVMLAPWEWPSRRRNPFPPPRPLATQMVHRP